MIDVQWESKNHLMWRLCNDWGVFNEFSSCIHHIWCNCFVVCMTKLPVPISISIYFCCDAEKGHLRFRDFILVCYRHHEDDTSTDGIMCLLVIHFLIPALSTMYKFLFLFTSESQGNTWIHIINVLRSTAIRR